MSDWHEIAYPISLNYRNHWSTWEALREIIQNALDETGSFEVIQDQRGTIIRDNGSGLAIKHLLFGVSEKKFEDSRGRFGEGLKIALVVLKRLGYDVTIRSNSLEVKTSTHEIEGEQCLKLLYRKIDNHIDGTEVIIHGYHGPTFEERFTIKKTPIWSGETIFNDKAEIYEEDKPRLYVKDIYVQDLPNATFSYNLWNVRLEESRNIADPLDLKWELGKLWASVSDYNLLIKFMEALKQKRWEYHNCRFFYASKYQERLRSAFRAVFGQNAFLKCSDMWTTEAKWRGGIPIELPSEIMDGFIKSGIPTDERYVLMKSGRTRIPVPDSELTDTQLENLLKLRKIARRVFRDDGEIQIRAFKLPPDEEGVWMRHTKTIAISVRALNYFLDAFSTFHHELTHAIYKTTDGTHELIHALSKCAALIAAEFGIPGKVKLPNNAYRKFRQRYSKSSSKRSNR